METSIRTVCFTGHRQIPPEEYKYLQTVLWQELEHQFRMGARIFRCGGALGFDTMAAEAVLILRQKAPFAELELILPCPTQAESWREPDRKRYMEILSQANRIRYTGAAYYHGILQMRNRQLVEGADVCIAYLRNSHGGGAAYTSALALRSGLEYINLAERIHCGFPRNAD